MSEESILDIVKEKKETPAVEKEAVKEDVTAEQKKLDWRSGFTDETLKVNKGLHKFKTVEDLAGSYLNLEKALGNKEQHNYVNPEEIVGDYNKAMKASEKIFSIDENTKYDLDTEKEQELALKHKLPAQLVNAYNKELKEVHVKTKEVERAKKVSEYKEQISDLMDEKKLKVRVKAGLNALGMTDKEWHDTLGVEAINPKLIKALAKVGKSVVSEEDLDIKEGGTGGLPSDIGVLSGMLKALTHARLSAPKGSKELFDIEQELSTVKVKYDSVRSSSTNKTNLF